MVVCLALLALGIGTPKLETFDVDGVQRQATIYAPTTRTANPPVVFVWHPHGGNMQRAENLFKIEEAWPEALVVYPQGLPTKTPVDRTGRMPGWQRVQGDSGDRDLKFFDVLFEKVRQEYAFDRKKVYSMGFSNGAFFTYLLWHARGDKLAGVAMAAASIDEPNKPLKPLPAFIIAGEKDPLVPFAQQQQAILYDREIAGIPKEATPIEKNGVRYFRGPQADVAVHIHPRGHLYPRALTPDVVGFFQRH